MVGTRRVIPSFLAIRRLRHRLVLGFDKSALAAQPAFGIARDEGAGDRDFDGIVDDRPIAQPADLRVARLEPGINLVWYIVCVAPFVPERPAPGLARRQDRTTTHLNSLH